MAAWVSTRHSDRLAWPGIFRRRPRSATAGIQFVCSDRRIDMTDTYKMGNLDVKLGLVQNQIDSVNARLMTLGDRRDWEGCDELEDALEELYHLRADLRERRRLLRVMRDS